MPGWNTLLKGAQSILTNKEKGVADVARVIVVGDKNKKSPVEQFAGKVQEKSNAPFLRGLFPFMNVLNDAHNRKIGDILKQAEPDDRIRMERFFRNLYLDLHPGKDPVDVSLEDFENMTFDELNQSRSFDVLNYKDNTESFIENQKKEGVGLYREGGPMPHGFIKSDDELLDKRLSDVQVSENSAGLPSISMTVDGEPKTFTFSELTYEAYKAGALPKNTLANAILRNYDNQVAVEQARMEERMAGQTQDEGRTVSLRK